jgi:hypothetical protein
MKKALILSILTMVVSVNAKAAELKEGALYCVSAKKIHAYYDYKAKGLDDFAKKLMDSADCFVKGRNETAIVRLEQKEFVELELISGFKVWTKKDNIIQ